ncbi:MAG TPA: DEAD/DEAH box helicase [Pirellulales bacterium]|nr:DEAD/DEAH box helicase [Pirellulales bacterium]
MFHPLVASWFGRRFGEPTEPQRLGWPSIAAGRHTLIAAPTGSGKTLAAFLSCLDQLLKDGLAGDLPDATQVVYISPLKALSNDIHRNLEIPLAELTEAAEQAGHQLPPIRAAVRTGDTPASQRQAMLRRPPHILVTTPESLYLLLTSAKSRETLRSVRTVIVDEIHALARDKRGTHLALSLERLELLCQQPPVRIGLSATQSPIEEIAQFLVGERRLPTGRPDCTIIDSGHLRELDLNVELPTQELSAVCSQECWGEIYARLAELIAAHRSTLVFVNTRRLAERVTHHLSETLGADAVASHHGSLSRHLRLSAEERLKNGELKAIVATASLEMGIDVGYIDLVCQIGSPRAIATLLQRVGRSGHSLGLVPKGRLFPLTRDELLECLGLLRAVRNRRLDRIEIPRCPLDILAQQIVAMAACEDWQEDELYQVCRRAMPYHDLGRAEFDRIIEMLADGVAPSSRTGAYLHRDRIDRRVRGRRGARLAAITSGGAIPEVADFRVVTEDDRTFVGTLNEDFALESLAGDVFLLGNSSWRIRYVRGGEVVVNDAQGAPASIPFWLGEAPGRTIELSAEVSRLRAEIAQQIDISDPAEQARVALPLGEGFGASAQPSGGRRSGEGIATNLRIDPPHGPATEILLSAGDPQVIDAQPLDDESCLAPAIDWLCADLGVPEHAAVQAARYVAAQKAAVGMIPTQGQILFERFFDESGGMQLVIHAPLGTRINRAWGLALRKRFCRSFDFELQASAGDNGVVLSLGPQHSFAIDALFKVLSAQNGEDLLKQAVLASPIFQTRWRWNLTRSLAVLRFRGGKKVPPQLQRFRSDDLLAAVFPASAGCLENHSGDVEIPDHPIVNQTMYDCLHEAMDLDRWLKLLAGIHEGQVELVGLDTREPSPFSHELLNANPYAFLDDAPLEERRTRAVATRRSLSVEAFRDLGRLDPEAIAQVSREAWPLVRDADELLDVLNSMCLVTAEEAVAWRPSFDALVAAGRATRVLRPGRQPAWSSAERWPLVQAVAKDATIDPAITLPAELVREWSAGEAMVVLLRGRVQCTGPTTAEGLANHLGLDEAMVSAALEALEAEGTVLRGSFIVGPSNGEAKGNGIKPQTQWCDRRLLARIHRRTLDGLRRQIQPVDPIDYIRYLLEHQHLTSSSRHRGRSGVRNVLAQLEGFEVGAALWERRLLAGRIEDYEPRMLDELAMTGELVWGRLRPPRKDETEGPSSAVLTRAVPITLALRKHLNWLLPPGRTTNEAYARSNAQLVLEALQSRGALFVHELQAISGLLPTHLEEALQELAALGLVTADAFVGVRALVAAARAHGRRRRPGARRPAAASSGRWSLFPGFVAACSDDERLARWAGLLLDRWGVLFRDVLVRETAAPAWGQLLPVLRRMEAKGEIRGGRFVAGVAGEQYALPGAVEQLRRMKELPPSGETIVLAAADPAHLAGIITDEPRVPVTHTNTVAIRDGRLLAAWQAGEARFFADLPSAEAREIQWRLRRIEPSRPQPAQPPVPSPARKTAAQSVLFD